MKKLQMIFCFMLLNCFKNINIKLYNKEHSSNEENNSKKENKNLMKAIKNKNITKILEALENGANINHEDHKGRTPLMYAIKSFSGKSIFKKLIEAGANTSKISIFDDELMHHQFKLVKFLIEKGFIDVNMVDNNGRTILGNICYHGSYTILVDNITGVLSYKFLFENRILNLFISKGADFNTQDIDGNTPLINSIRSHCYDDFKAKTIRKLVKFGANINVKNNSGYSPLILASAYGNSVSVKTLLELNADIFAKNNLGENSLISSIAEMIRYFESHVDNIIDFGKMIKKRGKKS